jgi:hypothetical protein
MASRLSLVEELTTDKMGETFRSHDVTLMSLGTLLCFLANGYTTSFCITSLQHKEKCSTQMLCV